MPQDIPVEASEVLSFTPPSLAQIPGAPSFILRACTPRDQRWHRRLIRSSGLETHSPDEVRAAVIEGLRQNWTPEAVERHEPLIRAYWEALDDFELQKKDNPDLVWEYDPDIEAGVKDMIRGVQRVYRPLGVMAADNRDFEDMLPILIASVVVKGWTGLETPFRLDSGYLQPDSAEEAFDELYNFEKRHAENYKLSPGAAFYELFIACMARMRLGEDEAGNSESRAASATTQAASTPKKASAPAGKSRASGRSRKTPAS